MGGSCAIIIIFLFLIHATVPGFHSRGQRTDSDTEKNRVGEKHNVPSDELVPPHSRAANGD